MSTSAETTLSSLPSDLLLQVLTFLGSDRFERGLELSSSAFHELGARPEFVAEKRKMRRLESVSLFLRGMPRGDTSLVSRAAELGLPSAKAELAYRVWKEVR